MFDNKSYQLTYAGIPFVTDKAASIPDLTGGVERNFQPQFDLMYELNRMLPPEYLRDFALPDNYPGKNLSALAHPSDIGPKPDSKIRIGDWYYPTGVRRWSVFRGLATSSQVKAMMAACRYEFTSLDAGFYSGAFSDYQAGSVPFSGAMNYPMEIATQGVGTLPAQFVMKCVPEGAKQGNAPYEVQSSMFMLPPRPLGELSGTFDGLYLVTLVDERFYMQSTPALLELQRGMTWEFLLNELAITLGIELSTFSTIETVYGQPELDSQFWSLNESAAALLDAVALNLGRAVVRNYDGSYILYTPIESQQIVNANRGIANPLFPVSGHLTSFNTIRTAGGDMFVSGMRLPVGELTNAKNWVVPNNVVVSFPKFIVGNDPVPHFVDRRTQSARSRWYEDSYGGIYSVTVPIQSGGINVSGLVGQSDTYLHDTAKALLSGEVAINSGTPLNNSGLVALSVRLAQDYYNNQVGAGIDEVYPGIVNWAPEGLCDVLFTYSEAAGGAFTRAMRKSWTNEVDEFQHDTPNYSGLTGGPGVGGKSVAQVVRDSFGQSGSFVGLSGTSVPLNPSFPLSGTWVQSGAIQTRLNQTLLSGGLTASFLGIDHFPTQNRWWGKVIAIGLSDEVVLFEGTSGGVAGVYSGNLVGIVQRGALGTIQRQHENQSVVVQTTPDVGYNVNLTTYEKGQFVYPSEWTSGGIQGVNVVPQFQTVTVLDNTGVVLSGTRFHSGRVNVFDSTQLQSGPWLPTDFVWVVSKNSGIPLLSGLRYDGNLLGYSVFQAGGPGGLSGGMFPSPIYGVAEQVYSLGVGRGPEGTGASDGEYSHNLIRDFNSGDMFAVFDSVEGWPTYNRFFATTGHLFFPLSGTGGIRKEVMLMNPTSGGVIAGAQSGLSGSAGFLVSILIRGMFGTVVSGTTTAGSGFTHSISEIQGMLSGVTQILFDSSQKTFLYPNLWNSGAFAGSSGFSGLFPPDPPKNQVVVLQPQQYIVLRSASGQFFSGLAAGEQGSIMYSGGIAGWSSDSGGNWTADGAAPSVWVRVWKAGENGISGNNTGDYRSGMSTLPLQMSGVYLGNLVGYSTKYISGQAVIAPLYAVQQDTDYIYTAAVNSLASGVAPVKQVPWTKRINFFGVSGSAGGLYISMGSGGNLISGHADDITVRWAGATSSGVLP